MNTELQASVLLSNLENILPLNYIHSGYLAGSIILTHHERVNHSLTAIILTTFIMVLKHSTGI